MDSWIKKQFSCNISYSMYKFRHLFIIFLGLILFAVIFNKDARAFCMERNFIGGDCNEEYDCSNHIISAPTNEGRSFCDQVAPGSCYEIFGERLEPFTICFAKKNEPTPTPASCGTQNYYCCTSPPRCLSGLTPVNVPGGSGSSSCVCMRASPTPTASPSQPTNIPTPINPESSHTFTTTFCEEEGFGSDDDNPKIRTALGCIPVTIEGFIDWFLPILFGIAGGIAFLIMVFGFINLAVSGDDPTKVQGAKDTIISAISGLVLIIFALFILRFILIVILKIPGIE